MFGKIKQYALAALAWALGNKPSETDVKALSVLDTPRFLRHIGKGRNKQPHRFSGVASAKRAARKARNRRKAK